MDYNNIENKIINVLKNTFVCTLATANKSGVVSTAQMSLVSMA